MKPRRIISLALSLIAITGCCGQDWKQNSDGIIVRVADRKADGPALVRLQVKGDNLVRVTATPETRLADRKSLHL